MDLGSLNREVARRQSCGPSELGLHTREQSTRGPERTDKATYEPDCPGPWLRTWVEFQVDARINQALRDLATGELFHGDGRESIGSTLDSEVRTVAEAHDRLCVVVEGLSRELQRASLAAAAPAERALEASVAEMDRTVKSATASMEFMQVALQDVAAKQESTLVDVLRIRSEVTLHEGTLAQLERFHGESMAEQREGQQEMALVRQELGFMREEVSTLGKVTEQLELHFSEWRDKALVHSEDKHDRVLAIEELRNDLASAHDRLEQTLTADQQETQRKLELWQTELEKSLERELHQLMTRSEFKQNIQDFMSELAEATVTHADLEHHLSQEQHRLDGRVVLREDFERQLSSLRQELGGAKEQSGQEQTADRVEDLQRGLEKRLEVWQVALEQELSNMNRRAASEIRAETRKALHAEAAAVAALDEQLWLTDKKLSRRIEEVVHQQGVESPGLDRYVAHSSHGQDPKGQCASHIATESLSSPHLPFQESGGGAAGDVRCVHEGIARRLQRLGEDYSSSPSECPVSPHFEISLEKGRQRLGGPRSPRHQGSHAGSDLVDTSFGAEACGDWQLRETPGRNWRPVTK